MSGNTRTGLLLISLALFFVAGVLGFISKSTYDRQSAVTPAGSAVGDFPVGGEGISETVRQMSVIYEAPIELRYQNRRILVSPDELGFYFDAAQTEADFIDALERLNRENSFIGFLFGKNQRDPVITAPVFRQNDEAVRAYLQDEISPRYDIPAAAKQPTADGTRFRPGHAGCRLDIEAAVPLIQAALLSDRERTAVLPVTDIPEPAAQIKNLEIVLKNVIDTLQDKGQITEVFLSDPQTGESFDIARRDKADLPPEIAFTAASTMKLPIMISSYARMDEEPTPITQNMLRLMITESKNDQTDWMMENIIGGDLAPLTVTDDMEALGMKNSFLAGYFRLGAPLLALVKTEANSRTDVDLKPDVYNQTTAKDMGMLMGALYRCSADGSGLLTEVFGEKITRHECEEMIQLLKDNHLPYLISAGVPDTIEVAHKHGWIEENDGLLHTMSNIGAVYTPGGDYILSIYTWHPENLIFDEGNTVFSHISTAVYDYFNPESGEE